jgi:hypothetical protein
MTIEIGTIFSDSYEAYSVTGFGKVTKVWEVICVNEDNTYVCRLLRDDSVMAINPNYTKLFNQETIKQLL